jgi:hypothetical protein
MRIQHSIKSSSFQDFALYIPIFLVLFMIGFLGGRAAGMSYYIQAPDNDNLTSATNRGNGQRNLVLLLVDQLSGQQPQLEGIWLLITLPQSSTLTLVPVYPGHIHKTQSIQESFVMTEGNQPGPEFLDVLTEQFLWDDFLVIDREGISSALNTLDRTGIEASTAFPQLSLEEQTSLLQSMCEHLSRFENRNDFNIWFDQVSPHFSTKISWDNFPLNTWGTEGIEDKLGCEFPTLNLISP